MNRALDYLKKQTPPIFHRDIKFENVLVDANGVIKLADLGLAATHDFGQTHTQGAGTPRWLAPEVLNGREYDYPSDQYSLALVALRILGGVLKNDGIVEVPADRRDELLMEYLERQLKNNPTERMTCAEVLEMFKGRGSSTRGFIKLPPQKERLISPVEIEWQKTTEADRRSNDELRRLAIVFTQALNDEKDIFVVADVLKLLPFVGVWQTRRGISIERSANGSMMLPTGVLGPQAPQTPFKAAFMKNLHGRDKDEDESVGESPRTSGTAPVARRLIPRSDEEDEVEPTKKNPVVTQKKKNEVIVRSPSSKLVRARSNAKINNDSSAAAAGRGAKRGRKSVAEVEEDEEEEVPTKKLSTKTAGKRAGRPAPRCRSSVSEADPDSMDVDEDGVTSDFEGSDVEESNSFEAEPQKRRPPPSRRSSKLNSDDVPLAARRPVRAASVKEEPKRRAVRRRTDLASAASSTNNTMDGTISIETEKENWDQFTIDEKVDKIVSCDEWQTAMDEWSKARRIGVPETDSALRRLLASLLETDLGEKEWIKANNGTTFAKKVWDWVIEQHDLWRDANRGKKRKRAI